MSFVATATAIAASVLQGAEEEHHVPFDDKGYITEDPIFPPFTEMLISASASLIVFALLWFACAPLGLMAFIVSSGVVASVVLGVVATYRQSRITAFLNPDTADPLGPAYQARQALYSLADGGLFGAGLGQGRAKWDYLPNADNDFIFAIIGEELGFVGAFAVVALFATLAYVGLRIAAHFYNTNMKRHGGRLEAVLTGKVLNEAQRKCMVWDIERGAAITAALEAFEHTRV